MPYSTKVIRLLENLDPALREIFIAILEEIEKRRRKVLPKRVYVGLSPLFKKDLNIEIKVLHLTKS